MLFYILDGLFQLNGPWFLRANFQADSSKEVKENPIADRTTLLLPMAHLIPLSLLMIAV